MIHIRNLMKSFGEKEVLKDVNIDVADGEIFALLGPSGAGKTTIINILTQHIKPDDGEVTIHATPDEIGLMLDAGGMYMHMSCVENLALYAGIYGVSRKKIDELLDVVGLGDSKGKIASELSRGMQQRLALARAILIKPRLLILDEPTSALDPGTARGICNLLQELRQKGATIFLTTHNMDEALKLCDRVALLHEGRIMEHGAPAELCTRYNAMRNLPDLEAVFLEVTGVKLA
jgi:ABC-2 type transport system ATP-binding protein